MPPRHAVPGLPQLPDSLHRLAKEHVRRPPDFLSGHAYENEKIEHRGDFAQEADLVREICGTYGGYETAEVPDVHRIGGGCALRGDEGKRVDGVFPGRPQSFRHQRRSVNDCSQDEKKWRRTAEKGGGRFMAKLTSSEKVRAGLRHAVVCPNVAGRAKEMLAQSKWARTGLHNMSCHLFVALRLFCFAFFSSACFY